MKKNLINFLNKTENKTERKQKTHTQSIYSCTDKVNAAYSFSPDREKEIEINFFHFKNNKNNKFFH